MIGFNHALVGGLLGKYVPWPVAIPLALVSHFVLDALPHYGITHESRDKFLFWKIFTTVDALLTAGLATWAIVNHHYAMFFAGLAGVIPDFIWVARVMYTRSFDLSQNTHWFTRWHVQIQRFEFPGGVLIEIPLAMILFYFVIYNTH